MISREGFDCSKKVYNIAKVKNNDTLKNVSAELFLPPRKLSLFWLEKRTLAKWTSFH